MRLPNLNALRMFDAAARHLNFRLAAQELNLTQGAVAQQVRRLEADLGLKLFTRKARGLELTEVGRGYHLPVRRALATIEEATRKLKPENTRLRLSVTPSFAAKWLVPRLSAFEQANPDVDVQTVATEALADFRTDGVDLAIRLGVPPFGDSLEAVLLAPLELCAVCSPDIAGDIGPITDVAEFADYRLIQDSHHQWDSLLDEAGLGLSLRKTQFNQTALAMDAAMNGQGIALVPHLLAEADIAQLRLVSLWHQADSIESGFYIVRPNAREPNPAQKAMVDWLLIEIGRS